MAVDHGLGGKDNKKSQQRREKKAKRTKAIALKALQSGTKRKEVVFNEVARTEWLTGFHKRKQERRKFGLAMQVMKDKKSHKDSVREQRSIIKAAATVKEAEKEKLELSNESKKKKRGGQVDKEDEDDGYDYDYVDDDDDGEKKEGDDKTNANLVFADAATTSMFGGAVSVVIDTGVADDLFEHNNPDLDSASNSSSSLHNKTQRPKKILTNFEKAVKVVNRRGLMNRKSKAGGSKGGGKYFEPAADKKGKGGKGGKKHTGKLLFHKALGSGALGSNTFKASKKGKRS